MNKRRILRLFSLLCAASFLACSSLVFADTVIEYPSDASYCYLCTSSVVATTSSNAPSWYAANSTSSYSLLLFGGFSSDIDSSTGYDVLKDSFCRAEIYPQLNSVPIISNVVYMALADNFDMWYYTSNSNNSYGISRYFSPSLPVRLTCDLWKGLDHSKFFTSVNFSGSSSLVFTQGYSSSYSPVLVNPGDILEFTFVFNSGIPSSFSGVSFSNGSNSASAIGLTWGFKSTRSCSLICTVPSISGGSSVFAIPDFTFSSGDIGRLNSFSVRRIYDYKAHQSTIDAVISSGDKVNNQLISQGNSTRTQIQSTGNLVSGQVKTQGEAIVNQLKTTTTTLNNQLVTQGNSTRTTLQQEGKAIRDKLDELLSPDGADTGVNSQLQQSQQQLQQQLTPLEAVEQMGSALDSAFKGAGDYTVHFPGVKGPFMPDGTVVEIIPAQDVDLSFLDRFSAITSAVGVVMLGLCAWKTLEYLHGLLMRILGGGGEGVDSF